MQKIRYIYINKLQDLLRFQPTNHQVAILHTDKPPYEELGYKDSRYYQRLDYPLHLKGTEYGAIYIVFDNTLTYPDILRLTVSLELPKLGKWHLGNKQAYFYTASPDYLQELAKIPYVTPVNAKTAKKHGIQAIVFPNTLQEPHQLQGLPRIRPLKPSLETSRRNYMFFSKPH